jgi:DNA-damage-inducible protein J
MPAKMTSEYLRIILKILPQWLLSPLDTPSFLGYNVAQQEAFTMTDNSVVRARIDERTKQEAAAVLKTIGLTLSDAFRLLLVRVAAEKALPFELLTPNAETIEAMEAARRGELVNVGKPENLLKSLNAPDR